MPMSIKYVFMGYVNNYKGCHYLDIASGKVYISCNVQFAELTFPFEDLGSYSLPSEQSPQPLVLEQLMYATSHLFILMQHLSPLHPCLPAASQHHLSFAKQPIAYF